MEVRICSREEAERLVRGTFPVNTAVIGFCDPGDTSVDYRCAEGDVFIVYIPDIDPVVLEDYGYTMDSYLAEADELAEFISEMNDKGKNLLIQCEFGQSRSAGCAAAIREYYHKDGIKIFADYAYYPNQLVYNKVYSALCKLHN